MVLAAGALAMGACSSQTQARCPCPSGGDNFALPASLPAAVTDVSTDAPCTVQTGANNVFLQRPSDGTCVVRVSLANGDTYQMTVEFKAPGNGCCGSTEFVVDASTLALVDGGAGGG